jgi:hypothetical protein
MTNIDLPFGEKYGINCEDYPTLTAAAVHRGRMNRHYNSTGPSRPHNMMTAEATTDDLYKRIQPT